MNLRLSDPWFHAHFYAVDDDREVRFVDQVAGAHGILFFCPCAYGCPDGAHACMIPFANPRGITPEPHGWQMSGSSLDDLTLSPSLLNRSGAAEPCWHGTITNGEFVTL